MSALTQRPSWRAPGRNHENVKGFTCRSCSRSTGRSWRAVRGGGARCPDYARKPKDRAADATSGRVVVAEDHHPEGGLGSAVVAGLLNAGVQQRRLADLRASELPGSGTTAELLAAAGIDATHIASAAAPLIEE